MSEPDDYTNWLLGYLALGFGYQMASRLWLSDTEAARGLGAYLSTLGAYGR